MTLGGSDSTATVRCCRRRGPSIAGREPLTVVEIGAGLTPTSGEEEGEDVIGRGAVEEVANESFAGKETRRASSFFADGIMTGGKNIGDELLRDNVRLN